MQRNDIKSSPLQPLLSLPAVLIVGVITQGLFLATIVFSLIKWIVVRPDLGIKFYWLKNYLKLFTSFETLQVVGNTVFITVLSLAFCLVLGVAFSLMLNRTFAGINFLRTLMLMPFFMMDAVIGIIWKTLILHPSFGIAGYFSTLLKSVPIDFLGEHAFLTVVMLIVWQWTPFFILIILAGLQGIDEQILDSAKVDGAGWFRTLFSVKLPSIMHHIEVAIMLGLIFILKVFGLIYVTTSGGPGYTTTNLPFLVYKINHLKWDVGEAASYAVLTVFLTLATITVLFKYMQKKIAGAEG